MQTLDNATSDWIRQHQAMMDEQKQRSAMEQIRADHEQRTAQAPSEAEAKRNSLLQLNATLISNAIDKAQDEIRKHQAHLSDLSDPDIYRMHADFLLWVANNLVLAPQHRPFMIDDCNRDVLRFLLYYFNSCPLAESVFPGRGYKLHKHILLQGNAGTGKTLLMHIFSEYLRLTKNPNHFFNLSVTQMVNYYTLHNNLDRFTYNEEENRGFKCTPVNICLNDIGVQTTTFYGMDTRLLADEFLHARNEIWVNYQKYAHLTTNLDNKQLADTYRDSYGRLIDRFKTYNIIPLTGSSRR